MLPYCSERLTNLDVVDSLTDLRAQMGDARLRKLREGLKSLLGKTYLTTLPFHTKTFLADVLEGG
jgi:hypothetical protein